MVSIKIICVASFLMFAIVLLFTNNGFVTTAFSYAEGPPPGHTGAPGDPPEQICNVCHAPNAGPGIMTINAPANYIPGQTYQIHVQHSTTDMTRLRWGFQLTALDALATMAGTFTDTSAFTHIDFGNSRFYIEHNKVGTFPGTTGGAEWIFDWNAPATDVGLVTFYAAGNQANNDNTFDGDQIVTATTVTAPAGTPTPTATATATPTPAQTPSISGNITYGNPASPTTKFISNANVCTIGASPDVCDATDPPGATVGQYVLAGFGSSSFQVNVTKTTGQNGISSFDASQIAQHVAGIAAITAPRRLIAADTTGNGGVSSQDAAKIAQFAAGLPPVAPQFTNIWRFFVPGAGQPSFPIGSSPTTLSYNAPVGVQTNQDFIGILIGEVSGNWNNTGARPPAEAGIGPERNITVELPAVAPSVEKEIIVPLQVQNIANQGIVSYEFDLKYDPALIKTLADPVDINGTVSRGLSVVTNSVEPGLLRVVVYGAMPIDEDGVLLNLRFTAVGTAGMFSPLTFERIMFNENDVVITVINGEIETR